MADVLEEFFNAEVEGTEFPQELLEVEFIPTPILKPFFENKLYQKDRTNASLVLKTLKSLEQKRLGLE